MSRYNCTSPLLISAMFVALVVYSCANRGYPEGGIQDKTPPKVTVEDPVSFTRNFDKKNIKVYFDEFVQLKEINDKFIISPPLKKKPKVSLRGKYILVDLAADTLKPNTTYSLDFADAIVDNNEGNPMGYYRYVLSTGNNIDTLELSGNVVNAESGEPILNSYVLLYQNHADSVPLLQLPDYIARTDSSGFFRVTNLKDTIYRVVALLDADKNYKFLPEGETVGFLDSLVHPVVMPLTRTDTIKRIDKIVGRDTIMSDSISTIHYIGYGPNNLRVRLFDEKPTKLYMVNDERKERTRLDFTFSIPGENNFSARLKDTVVNDWYIPEYSIGRDSITLWITDSMVYKKDTLNVILNYLRTVDSLRQNVSVFDTSRYDFKDKEPEKPKGKKKEEPKAPEIQFLGMNSNAGGEFDLNGRIVITFDKPINKEGLQHIQLLEKVDTLYKPMKYTLKEDSVKIRQFYVDAALKAEKEYMLKVDSAVIFDIYGHHNNKLEKAFKVRSPEYYGKIVLSVSGTENRHVLIQLYKSENTKSENGKRKYAVVRGKAIDKDGDVSFDLLPEGKYMIRAVLDANHNGKWDTGLYLKRIQPEEIIYLPVEINVKQNFDIEQEFDLHKLYEKVKN